MAGWAAVAAAREFESAGYPDTARRCLEKALEFWERAEEGGETLATGGPSSQLALADTLRRLGRFADAQLCCHRGLSGRPADPVRSLLEFEVELIAKQDTQVHSVDEVICRRIRGKGAGHE